MNWFKKMSKYETLQNQLSDANGKITYYSNLYKEALDKIKKLQEINIDNANTIQELRDAINEDASSTCQIGPWCQECKYKRVVPIKILKEEHSYNFLCRDSIFYKANYTNLTYCAKHLKNICPEYEKEGKEVCGK